MSHRTPCLLRANGGEAAGETINLSDGGVAVVVGTRVDEGSIVEVHLPEFGGVGLQFVGRVRHTRRISSGAFEVGLDVEPAASTL